MVLLFKKTFEKLKREKKEGKKEINFMRCPLSAFFFY